MSKTKKEIPLWAKTGHSKPVTRREFLAAGLMPFAAQAIIPSWWQLLLQPESAFAQTGCGSGTTGSGLIPFITVNLAGGASLASNFVPMDQGGQPLTSYSKMGLGNGAVPITREFGNVPFAGELNGALISKFLEGLRSTASASIPNTAFVAVCVRSRDDSDENAFDVSGMVTKAGLVGSVMPNLGSNNTRTGIRHNPATIMPPSPLIVRNFSNVSNALLYSSALSRLSQTQKEKMASTISKLNSIQTRKLANEAGGDKVKEIFDCANIKNESVLKAGVSAVDPRSNQQIANLWEISSSTSGNNQNLIFATMVYNGLLGNAGSVNLEIGGFDYHDNTRTTGDRKDREAGVLVGRILETARILQKPLFLYVPSDGSCNSPDSQDRMAPWASDRGIAGANYMIMYNPRGRVETTGFQVGHFTNNQAVDDKFITGNSPELASQAVFANYLKMNNRMDLFEKVIRQGLTTNDLNKVIKVA